VGLLLTPLPLPPGEAASWQTLLDVIVAITILQPVVSTQSQHSCEDELTPSTCELAAPSARRWGQHGQRCEGCLPSHTWPCLPPEPWSSADPARSQRLGGRCKPGQLVTAAFSWPDVLEGLRSFARLLGLRSASPPPASDPRLGLELSVEPEVWICLPCGSLEVESV